MHVVLMYFAGSSVRGPELVRDDFPDAREADTWATGEINRRRTEGLPVPRRVAIAETVWDISSCSTPPAPDRGAA